MQPMMRAHFHKTTLCLTALVLLACACEEPPPEPMDEPDADPCAAVSSTMGGERGLYACVIETGCAIPSCHGSRVASQGLELGSLESTCRGLIDADARQSDLPRVSPFNPSESWLMHKLEGTSGASRMPPSTSGALPEAVIAAFRTWIEAGAACP